ncbi:Dyp-type peroxidase [Arsenicicoccus piscis]|nr:Dyp-type peroxidase [Arsenicicoccus piscis]MCH8629031.1 Dyp-type peroxidase [Arsenicicoccus piscis]
MFIGVPPGNHDRILDFSTAVTGALFFVPNEDFLDDPVPQGPVDRSATTSSTSGSGSADGHPDGSLGIGRLSSPTNGKVDQS